MKPYCKMGMVDFLFSFAIVLISPCFMIVFFSLSGNKIGYSVFDFLYLIGNGFLAWLGLTIFTHNQSKAEASPTSRNQMVTSRQQDGDAIEGWHQDNSSDDGEGLVHGTFMDLAILVIFILIIIHNIAIEHIGFGISHSEVLGAFIIIGSYLVKTIIGMLC